MLYLTTANNVNFLCKPLLDSFDFFSGRRWLDGEQQKKQKPVTKIVDHIWHRNVQMCPNVKNGVWRSSEKFRRKSLKYKTVNEHRLNYREIPPIHTKSFTKFLFQFAAGLGEFRIRDLNDEINKLLREKRHWENQISALGGPHYRRYGPKMFDAEGREVPGNRGYKYFGAAKDLPGVRELFEQVHQFNQFYLLSIHKCCNFPQQEPPPPPKKNRGELMKDVDADYYGYRDDDDGVLIPLEEKAEKLAQQTAIQKWKEKQNSSENNKNVDDDDELYHIEGDARIVETTVDDSMGLLAPRFTAHVPVPTQKDIEAALLRKKKQELLEKYGIGTEN